MPCVSPDGSVTESAKRVLLAAVEEKSAEEIAKAAGLPLFRVRGSVRELVDAGLIESRNGTYRTTEQGKVKIV
jgi:Sugar-specific transcriptional regulator TrmB.